MTSPQQPAAYNSGVGYPVNQVIDGNLTLVDVYGTGQYGILTAAQINTLNLGLAKLTLTAPSSSSTVISESVTGDTSPRFTIDANGKIQWGPGNAALDTVLYRQAPGQLAGPGVGGFSFNALTFGMDPTFTHDSGPALNSAMAAAAALGSAAGAPGGGAVYIPPGKYKISTQLVPQSGVRVFGDNSQACELHSAGINMWNMGPASTLWYFELDHVYLAASTGDIFEGANLGRCHFHDCEFQVNSAANSIWDSTAGPGLFQDTVFENNLHSLNGGAPRSKPAWNLYMPDNSDQVNNVTWRDEKLFNNDADNTQYCFSITGALGVDGDHNVWENCIFENFLGGLIFLNQCRGSRIVNACGWDSTANYMQSLINITGTSGGVAVTDNVIQASGRISGTLNSSAVSDIQLDTTCNQTLIVAPRGSSAAPVIDLGGGSGTTIVGLPTTGYTLRNATGTYNLVGSGGLTTYGGTLNVGEAGDADPRFSVANSGVISMGGGAAAVDTSFTRTGGHVQLTNVHGLAANLSVGATTGVTLAPTITAATPTNIAAFTIPSSDANINSTYRIQAWGFGTWGNPAASLEFQAVYHSALGTANIDSTVFTAGAAFVWEAEGQMQVLTTGGSGTYVGYMKVTLTQTANHIVPGTVADNTVSAVTSTTAAVTGATNGAFVFSLQFGWSSATGSPTITALGGLFTRLA